MSDNIENPANPRPSFNYHDLTDVLILVLIQCCFIGPTHVCRATKTAYRLHDNISN